MAGVEEEAEDAMTASCTRWKHIFRALARSPGFTVHHSMKITPSGLVFKTVVPYKGGFFFRQMFAVLPDGRIFGPRNRQVAEVVLVAWFNDHQGLDDVL